MHSCLRTTNRLLAGLLLMAVGFAGTAWAVPIGDYADLSLTKTVSDASPLVGTTVSFTVTVRNDGAPTRNIKIHDWLSGACYDPVSVPPVTKGAITGHPNQGVIWTLDLGTGESAQLTQNVHITCVSGIENLAEITFSGTAGDSSSGNDWAAVQVYPRAATDIRLEKTVTMDEPVVGQRITFELSATNEGQSTKGVVIEDLFVDPGNCFMPVGPPELSTGSRTTRATRSVWILDLDYGETATLTQTGFATCKTQFVNNARMESSGTVPDSDSSNDHAQVIVRPSEGKTIDLAVSKLVDNPYPVVGDVVIFTITVSNELADKHGRIFPTNFARDIQVADYLPHGLTLIQVDTPIGTFDNGVWSIPELGPGKQASFSIHARVEAEGEYTNCAEVWDADMTDRDSFTGAQAGYPMASYPVEDDEACASLWAGPLLTDLEVTKVVSDDHPVQDDIITYSITVLNRMNEQGVEFPTADATGLRIADYLQPTQHLIPESVTNGGIAGVTFDPVTMSWFIERLPAGKGITLTFQARVTQPGEYQNCAEVHAVNEYDRDSRSAVQAGGPLVGHEDDQDCVEIWVEPRRPDLELVKTVSNDTPRLADFITYNLTILNREFVQGTQIPTAEATNVIVKDYLPHGLWYEQGSATDGSQPGVPIGIDFDESDFSWHIDALAPGKSVTLSFRVRVEVDGEVRNCAEIWDADQGDRDSRSGAEAYGKLVGGPSAEDDQDCAEIWVDLAAEPTGSVSGIVFLDSDRDGYLDHYETGLPGFEVDLVEIGLDRTCGTWDDREIMTMDTDKNGAYTFWDVDPGEYCVRILDITIPAGYFRTTPGRVPVWISSGTHLSGVHFGFRESYPSYPLPRMAEALCYLAGPDASLTLLTAGSQTDQFAADLAGMELAAMTFHPWTGMAIATDGGSLSMIDPATGAIQMLGRHGTATGLAGTLDLESVAGLSVDPFTGDLYGLVARADAPALLVQIDAATGQVAQGAFGAQGDYLLLDATLENASAIAIDPVDGALYALGQSADGAQMIARIDRTYGAVEHTLTPDAADLTGLSFFNNGTLYATARGEQPLLLSIDKTSGATALEATLGQGAFGMAENGVGYDSDGSPGSPLRSVGTASYSNAACLTGAPNTVSAELFADANGDGTRQDGEGGVSGVLVDVFRDTNANGFLDTEDLLVGQSLSGDDGAVRFEAASNGDFLLQVVSSSLPFGASSMGQPLGAAAGSFGVETEAGTMALTGATSTANQDEMGAELPDSFRLEGNYPNPFNPQTTLSYAAPQSGHIRLAVYDVLGREVALLVDGVVEAGQHKVTFSADRLPSGTYFARMVAAGVAQTRTMVLIK